MENKQKKHNIEKNNIQKKPNMEKSKNGKKKKTKKKHRILRVFLIFILIIILFLGGFVGYSAYKNGWGLRGLLQTMTGQSEEALQNLPEFRVLLLGVSEDISAQLTDTIMVASYNPREQKAVLLSIPRDTFVGDSRYSANSYDKINALYQSGEEEATLEAVNEITGLGIEYYMVISNNALVDLVDEIGGVEFDVPIDMDYDSSNQDLHIHLDAGLQTLSGEQAEWLLRFRHNNDGTTYPSEYGNNDYGRMRTQRDFLKAVAEQTLQLKNITKIGGLIDVVKENVTTNIKDWNAIKDYIPYAIDFSTDNLQTETIPGESRRIPANTGLYFFEHDETETEALIDELYEEQNSSDSGDLNSSDTSEESNSISSDSEENNVESNTTEETTTQKSDVKIEILNGSGDSTVLTKTTNKLKDEGYTVYKTGTTTTTSKTTIIDKSDVSSEITDDLKDILGTGIISSSSSSSSNPVDITIILGKDYEM